jgi:hypothetical protein
MVDEYGHCAREVTQQLTVAIDDQQFAGGG